MSNKIMITSGPTRGPVDAVRYISNKSSGKLGSKIAVEALKAGYEVTFVYGKGSITPDEKQLSVEESGRLTKIKVATVPDVLDAVEKEIKPGKYKAVIHLMAVLDYVPEEYRDEKLRSGKDEWTIKLVKTPKVIHSIRELDPELFLVSFKLEYKKTKDELINTAYSSLQKYSSNLCVVNDLKLIENGRHIAYFVNEKGEETGSAEGKDTIAKAVVQSIG